MTATPPASPADDRGCRAAGRSPVSQRGRDLDRRPGRSRRPRRRAGGPTARRCRLATPITAPRNHGDAGDGAEPDQGTDGRALVGQRSDDGQPLGGVVQGEPDDQRGAQGQFADRVGRSDRQTLAEVVQADPDGDHDGEPAARRRSPPIARPPPVQHAVDRGERRGTPGPHRAAPAPGRRTPRRQRRRGRTPRARRRRRGTPSSPTVSASSTRTTPRPTRRSTGRTSMPSSTGITPT